MKLHRRNLLNPVLLLALSAVAVRFDASGVTWLWHAQPGVVATALAVVAVVCCGWMLVPPRRGAQP